MRRCGSKLLCIRIRSLYVSLSLHLCHTDLASPCSPECHYAEKALSKAVKQASSLLKGGIPMRLFSQMRFDRNSTGHLDHRRHPPLPEVHALQSPFQRTAACFGAVKDARFLRSHKSLSCTRKLATKRVSQPSIRSHYLDHSKTPVLPSTAVVYISLIPPPGGDLHFIDYCCREREREREREKWSIQHTLTINKKE